MDLNNVLESCPAAYFLPATNQHMPDQSLGQLIRAGEGLLV